MSRESLSASTFRSRTFLATLCLLGLFSPMPETAIAQGRDLDETHLGAFCITNLPAGSMKEKKGKETEDGVWWEREIKIKKRHLVGVTPPRVYFFDSPTRPSARFVSCASQPDRPTVLEGNLNAGSRIHALVYKPNVKGSARRIQVNPGQLNVELGNVRSSVKTVLGAPVDFAGRLLWINNPGTVFVAPDHGEYDAVLEVQATDLRFPGARIRLGGQESAVVTTDLFNRSTDGRLVFELDVTRGDLVLNDGILRAGSTTGADFGWMAGGLQVQLSTFEAAGTTVTANQGDLAVELVDLALAAERLEHGAPLRATLVPSDLVRARTLRAQGTQSPEQLVLDRYTWQDLLARSDSVRVVDANGSPQLSGSGALKLASLDDQAVTGRLELRHPSIALAARLGLIQEPPALELDFTGAKDHLAFAGQLETSHLALGALRVEDDQPHPLQFAAADAGLPVFRIDFDFDLKPTAGRVTLVDPTVPSRPITLETRLDSFKTRGAIHVGLADDLPRLELEVGNIAASFAASTTARSALFGSPVQMVGASASLVIFRPVTLSPSGIRGSLELVTGGMIVADGRVDISDSSGEPFVLEGSLNTLAEATLSVDLATGRYSLHEAHFDLQGLRARSDGRIDVGLGGLRLAAPSLAIGHLKIDVVAGAGELVAEDFSFDAQSVHYPGPPAVELGLAAPLTIPSMNATLAKDQSDALKVAEAALFGLDLVASSARFTSPDGFSLHGQDAHFAARELASTRLDGSVTIATGGLKVEARDGKAEGSASFNGFRLSIDKSAKRLRGTGKLRLENVAIRARDRLKVGDCSEDKQWKLQARITIDQVDLDLELDDLRLTGESRVRSVAAEIRNDGYSRCEWDEKVVLWPKQQAIFDVPCGLKGFPPRVKMCRQRVTLVPEARAKIHWVAELHELDAKARLSEARVSLRGDRGVEICPEGIHLNPPLIVANYHPNIRSSDVPVVGNLLRDLIRGTATLFESTLTSLIGSQIAFHSYLREQLFPPQCFGG